MEACNRGLLLLKKRTFSKQMDVAHTDTLIWWWGTCVILVQYLVIQVFLIID